MCVCKMNVVKSKRSCPSNLLVALLLVRDFLAINYTVRKFFGADLVLQCLQVVNVFKNHFSQDLCCACDYLLVLSYFIQSFTIVCIASMYLSKISAEKSRMGACGQQFTLERNCFPPAGLGVSQGPLIPGHRLGIRMDVLLCVRERAYGAKGW